jgi:hypothetical protein
MSSSEENLSHETFKDKNIAIGVAAPDKNIPLGVPPQDESGEPDTSTTPDTTPEPEADQKEE